MRTYLRKLAPAALAVGVACASEKPVPDVSPGAADASTTSANSSTGAAAPRQSTFNAKVWVTWQETAVDCEASARALRQSNPQHAWEGLRACVEIGRFRRGPFTQLNLLTAYWEEALRARPDAPRLVGQIIANRGGDVDGDISRLQSIRMPVFTLGAAMKQPEVYKGRYVIVRAKLVDVKMDDKSATAMLAETSMRTAETVRGDFYVSTYSGSSNVRGSGSGSGAYSTDRYGGGHGSYTYGGEGGYSSSGSSTYGRGKLGFENVVQPTGLQALGKLPEADPFLEPNKEFIFVARFDGARPASAPNTTPVAALSIFTYFPPGALLME